MSVQMIALNPAKRGADNLYHKLEIPVSVAPIKLEQQAQPEAFCGKNVDTMAGNSNCLLEFSHAFGLCQVVASLQGPTESKFSSKQDY